MMGIPECQAPPTGLRISEIRAGVNEYDENGYLPKRVGRLLPGSESSEHPTEHPTGSSLSPCIDTKTTENRALMYKGSSDFYVGRSIVDVDFYV